MEGVSAVEHSVKWPEDGPTSVVREDDSFRCLFAASPDAIFIEDLEGNVLDVNPAACRLHGMDRAGLVGRNVLQLVPADHRASVVRDFPRLVSGECTRMDGVSWTADGRAVPVEIRTNRIEYEGRPALLLHVRDISDRKRAEVSRRESEELFRRLNECSPLGVLLTDPEGNCTYSNPRGRAILGVGLMECVGSGWTRQIHPDHRGPLMRDWHDAATSGREFAREFRLGGTVTGERWIHFRSSPMCREPGKLSGHVATVEDITRRKLAEVEREALLARSQQARAEAEEARDRLQELSRQLVEAQETERRRIAHELHDEIGQWLTMLKLSLDMARRESREEGSVYLANAIETTEQLLRTVRALSLELSPSALDDLGLLPALLWFVDRYTARSGIQVKVKHEGIQGRRFPRVVESTVYRIAQEALTNVARHAGVTEARMLVWRDEAGVTVQVEDGGKGFVPGPEMGGHRSGGLRGMRERTELLGGSFAVESAPGKGCCITAELPAGADEGNTDE